MKGIEFESDSAGKLISIKIDAKLNPELAADIVRISNIQERSNGKSQDTAIRSSVYQGRERLSSPAFFAMIEESRSSGEITQAEFFQLHPEWQRRSR